MRIKLAMLLVAFASPAICQPLTPGYRRPSTVTPRMACVVQAAPPFQGMTCPAKPGVRGSSCQCGDLPYPGHRDFVRF